VGLGALMLNQFVNIADAPQEILTFIDELGFSQWAWCSSFLFVL